MSKDFAHGRDRFREAIKSLPREALKVLPAEQREALILVGASNFSDDEAARICGCSIHEFRSRVIRTRDHLDQSLFMEQAVAVYVDESRIKIIRPTKADDHNPPKIAEFVLAALSSPSRGESMIGDLNERFACDCEKLGRDRAVRFYWARTLRSLWPLMRRAIGKALRWGVVLAMVKRIFDHTAA